MHGYHTALGGAWISQAGIIDEKERTDLTDGGYLSLKEFFSFLPHFPFRIRRFTFNNWSDPGNPVLSMV